ETQLNQRSALPTSPRSNASGLGADQWDPWQEMQMMQQEMNRLFRDSFSRGMGGMYGPGFHPQIDVKKTSDQYVMTMDLPGMDKNSINVQVKNGNLVVSGERSTENEVNRGQMFRQERSFGKFFRSFPLPDDAKADQVSADYNNGVLQIEIGRQPNAKPTE